MIGHQIENLLYCLLSMKGLLNVKVLIYMRKKLLHDKKVVGGVVNDEDSGFPICQVLVYSIFAN